MHRPARHRRRKPDRGARPRRSRRALADYDTGPGRLARLDAACQRRSQLRNLRPAVLVHARQAALSVAMLAMQPLLRRLTEIVIHWRRLIDLARNAYRP